MKLRALVLAALVARPALAAPEEPERASTAEDAALAEELFRGAKTLMADGKYAEACPKLAESQRLDPAGGTVLTLGLCHEALGKTASAWADFGLAIAFAKRDGRADREAIAREHADLLTPRLRRLRVRAPAHAPADVVVHRDGIVLGPAAWDVAAPVDPGEHVIEESAPGFAPVRLVLEAPEEGATRDVDLPGLAPLAAATPAPVREERREGTPPLRWGAYAAAAIGVIGLGAGTVFALDAKSKRDDANAACPAQTCTNGSAVDLSHAAGTRADLATAGFVVGTVGLATAVVLFVLSRPR